jgi:hypothetical protein
MSKLYIPSNRIVIPEMNRSDVRNYPSAGRRTFMGMTKGMFRGMVGRGGVVAAGGPSYVFTENFETATTGYDSTWTMDSSAGTLNPVATTSELDLEGFQCLTLTGTTPYVRWDHETAAYTTLYGYLLFRTSAVPASGRAILQLTKASDDYVFKVALTSDGTVQVLHGTNSATTVGTISANTTTHIWFYYKAGTGLNGEYSVGFSTNGTRATSGDNFASNTNGTSLATDPVEFWWCGGAETQTVTYTYDKMRLAETQIGDNPS